MINLYEQRKEAEELRGEDREELKTNFKYKDIEMEQHIRREEEFHPTKNQLSREQEGEEEEEYEQL